MVEVITMLSLNLTKIVPTNSMCQELNTKKPKICHQSKQQRHMKLPISGSNPLAVCRMVSELRILIGQKLPLGHIPVSFNALARGEPFQIR